MSIINTALESYAALLRYFEITHFHVILLIILICCFFYITVLTSIKNNIIFSLVEREEELERDRAEWHRHEGYQRKRELQLDEQIRICNENYELWNTDNVTQIRNDITREKAKLSLRKNSIEKEEQKISIERDRLSEDKFALNQRQNELYQQQNKLHQQQKKDAITKSNANYAMQRHKRKNQKNKDLTGVVSK